MSKSKKDKTIVKETPEVTPDIGVVCETATEETVETPPVRIYLGKIKNCDKLNVREEPKADAKVLCKLDKTSEVEIDMDNSTSDFYKVYTSSGVSGYCMKKFMTTKKHEV